MSHHHLLLLFLFVAVAFASAPASSSSLISFFRRSSPSSSSPSLTFTPPVNSPRALPSKSNNDYFELPKPLPSDHLTPSCVLSVTLHHQHSLSTSYSPPSPCPSHWSHVALHLHVHAKSPSSDLLSLWLGGVELLRTSSPGGNTTTTTPPSTSHPIGATWEVRKDVVKYSSILSQSNLQLTLTSLSRLSNDSAVPDVYQVIVTFLYYNTLKSGTVNSHAIVARDSNSLYGKLVSLRSVLPSLLQLPDAERQSRTDDGEDHHPCDAPGTGSTSCDSPADLVIPINGDGSQGFGFWFNIDNGSVVPSKEIQLPPNARRAVLELYASSHGSDLLWYLKACDSCSGTDSTNPKIGHQLSFRELIVTIDGQIVGSELPIPVISTDGINPFLWKPVVALGAFDFPSYDIDLTPFLGSLLDCKPHRIGVGVSHSDPYWLVNGNLHVWLDDQSSAVETNSITYHYPGLRLHTEQHSNQAGGSMKMKAKRKSKLLGWVRTSQGNLTMLVTQELEFKNSIKYEANGAACGITIEQKIESEREVMVTRETGEAVAKIVVERDYHLIICNSLSSSSEHVPDAHQTAVNMTLKEKHIINGKLQTSYRKSQHSIGLKELKDGAAIRSAKTEQSSTHRDENGRCYSRMVATADGSIVRDETSAGCAI